MNRFMLMTLFGLAMIESEAQEAELAITLQTNRRVRISWQTESNLHYRFLANSRVETSTWRRLANYFGNGEVTNITLAASVSQQYFRLELMKNPMENWEFYVDPDSQARNWVNTWTNTYPTNAYYIDKIAGTPQAIWLTGRETNPSNRVNDVLTEAEATNTVPVFVLYYIPLRDCGGFSSGGATNGVEYIKWINKIYSGIQGRKCGFIIEPDALAALDCLDQSNRLERISLIREAVEILNEEPLSAIYIDAGHSRWKSAIIMADRLTQAGISEADGFALNVSNFIGDDELIGYGTAISQLIGDKHFVIDTSRNGLGPAPDNEWCNPPGRALGRRPTCSTGRLLVDAYLWIKRPGESDGECNGGPRAGIFWPEYAVGLAERAGY